MSRLLDSIEAHRGEKRRPARQPLRSLDLTVTENVAEMRTDVMYQYDLSVRLGRSGWFKSNAEVNIAKSHIRQELSEFVYGEMRMPLRELGTLISCEVDNSQVRVEMLKILQDIEEMMK